MNRKTKLVISITGIIIILIGLISFTYAYYSINITGNTNEKSISVSTKKLSLVYGDGNGSISPSSAIQPGDTLTTKTFTVTNNGDEEAEYMVVLENFSVTNTATGAATSFVYPIDFVYTLSCTSTSGTCNGTTNEPLPMSETGLLISNKIGVGVTHTYTFTLKYLETDEDQSVDVNKSINAKINIKDPKYNLYNNKKTTLAYNIVNNAKLNNNGTIFTSVPSTRPVLDVSASNEKELSILGDDYGISYYYRGNVENNYINFAGMCFRIVRILGDGSIRLVLEDQNTTCNQVDYSNGGGNWKIGTRNYRYGAIGATDEDSGVSISKVSLLNPTNPNYAVITAMSLFKTSLSNDSSALSKMKIGEWCNDDIAYTGSYAGATGDERLNDETKEEYYSNDLHNDANVNFYYDSYRRVANYSTKATFRCYGKLLNNLNDGSDMYIGMLTMDEVINAGGSYTNSNTNYYLINQYQKDNNLTWWTLSLSQYSYHRDEVFAVFNSGAIYENSVGYSYSFRPAITLKSGTIYNSGDGTKTNPYTIN